MPFINQGITARSVEEYQRCEDALKRLNGMIQTVPENLAREIWFA
jgi:hypothetical protein